MMRGYGRGPTVKTIPPQFCRANVLCVPNLTHVRANVQFLTYIGSEFFWRVGEQFQGRL
jgi:hypothetical protein